MTDEKSNPPPAPELFEKIQTSGVAREEVNSGALRSSLSDATVELHPLMTWALQTGRSPAAAFIQAAILLMNQAQTVADHRTIDAPSCPPPVPSTSASIRH